MKKKINEEEKDLNTSEYSQEFDVLVSLNRSDFESVKTNILQSCNFGTEESRKVFSMLFIYNLFYKILFKNFIGSPQNFY